MFLQRQAFQLARQDPRHVIVTTRPEFERAMGWLSQQRRISVDTETSGTAWYRHASICGVSMSAWDGDNPQCFYFPVRHQTGEQQLTPEIFPLMKPLLESQTVVKELYNRKFDDHMFRREGIRLSGPVRDVMMDAAVYDENTPLALKTRASVELGLPEAHVFEAHLDAEIGRQAKLAKVGKDEYRDRVGFARIPIGLCGVYAAHDVDFTMRLARHYDQRGVTQFFAPILSTEYELAEVLCDMEENGLPVDRGYLTWLAEQTHRAMEALRPRMFAQLGVSFNPDSDDDVRWLLLEHFRLPLWKTTRSGAMSVDAEVIAEFSAHHEGLATLLEYREAAKINSTYTTSILDRLGAGDILHGDFQQMGTDTGRLSCQKPNLQNFAGDSNKRALAFSGKKLDDGGVDPWSVKRAFINRAQEYIRAYFDYSQIELRVLAYYSRDPVMLETYLKNEDIHSRTSMEVFGKLGSEERRKSKIIAFGLSYGMSEKGYARQAGVSEQQAIVDMAKFFERYSGIVPCRDAFLTRCRANGNAFVNLFGRARRIPDLSSLDQWLRGSAERRMFAAWIQGTAAQLTKESLVRVHHWEKKNRSGLKLVSSIHDEISLDIPRKQVRAVVPEVTRAMESFPQFHPVPILTAAEWSETHWGEKQDFPEEMIQHAWAVPRAA